MPVLLVLFVVAGVASAGGAQVDAGSGSRAVWATSCLSPGATELVVYGRGWGGGTVVVQVFDQNGAVVGNGSVQTADRVGEAVFQGRIALALPGATSSLHVVASQGGATPDHAVVVSGSCRPSITAVVSATPCVPAGRPVAVTVTVRGASTPEFDLLLHHVDLYGPAETIDRTQPPRPDGDYAFPLAVSNVPGRLVPITVEARRPHGGFAYATTNVLLPPACAQPNTTATSGPAPIAPGTTLPAAPTTTLPLAPGATVTLPSALLPPPPLPGGAQVSMTLSPVLGRGGDATTVSGQGFAPTRPLTLRWRPGIGEWTVTPGGDGSFRTQVLVLPHDVEGPRVLEVVGGGVNPPSYLVVPRSEQPAFGGVFVRG